MSSTFAHGAIQLLGDRVATIGARIASKVLYFVFMVHFPDVSVDEIVQHLPPGDPTDEHANHFLFLFCLPMSHSITSLFPGLRESDEDAARELFERCYERLSRQSRNRLGNAPARTFDESDIANSAINEFFERVARNDFKKLENREDVWQILAVLVRDKIAARLKHENRQKRGGGWERTTLDAVSDELKGLDDPAIQAMGDEVLAEFKSRLLSDDHREIVDLLLAGLTHQEIADRLGKSLRTIDRRIEGIREAVPRILGIQIPKQKTN